ncbi:MAG TPA: DUF882 domain-containing protein [Polyangiales bacterium]|nr:DUF882 domain-containing protein [Polyangiales bacterium]
MTQPKVARLLIWVAALGGMCSSARPTAAESRALLPIIAEPEEIEPAEPAEGADGAAKNEAKPGPVRKNAARKRAPVATKSPARAAQKAAARPGGPSGRQPTAEYRRIRDSWHDPIPPEQIEPVIEGALPPLVLAPIDAHGGQRVTLIPATDEGGFTEEQQTDAARAFAPQGRKKPHPVSPRLLDLVYRAMRHFDAPLVHLISGYRADRAGSRHTQGRAIDMVLPGVGNEELAAYVRQFGFVGVGVYPKSGFVHLDVRDNSFFWLDYSLPNERCRPEPTLMGEAKVMDQHARDRGEQPNNFVPNNDREDKAADKAYKRRAQRRMRAAQPPRSL